MASPSQAPAAPAAAPKKLRKQARLNALSENPLFGRMAIVNHLSRKVAKLAQQGNTFPLLSAFEPKNVAQWLGSYLKFAFTPKYPLPVYRDSGKTGVYTLQSRAGTDAIRIAIAGDWGTGTHEAAVVADLMSATGPDYTIHLGDVYYVGEVDDINENCLGKEVNGNAGVWWPHGTSGSFALNGNHEMYANGGPYFTLFLKSLGIPDGTGQVTSYFCLETDHWRILAIDTGYNSVGIPVLSQIPLLKNIKAIGGDCHLDDKILTWLRDVVKPNENPKPTVLLSHHQYFSGFGQDSYTKPAQQLMEFFQNQEVVWLWGHEHRLAIYQKAAKDGAFQAYGRCVGHGGMPTDTGGLKGGNPVQFYDTDQTHVLDDNTRVCFNGYVLMTLEGDSLTLDYRNMGKDLVSEEQLFVEKFKPGANGTLVQTFQNRKLTPGS